VPDSVETLRVTLDERHALYMTKFDSSEKAVGAALAAQEKLVSAAFESSEKAIVKAEEAQRAYNERSNEFRGQLDDQAKMLIPRAEAIQRFDALDKIVSDLQRGESRITGGSEATGKARQQANWIIGLVVTILIFGCGSIITLLYFLAQRAHP